MSCWILLICFYCIVLKNTITYGQLYSFEHFKTPKRNFKGDQQKIQFCGPRLQEAILMACQSKNRFFRGGSNYEHRGGRLSTVVDECCIKSCSWSTLVSYCPSNVPQLPKPTTTVATTTTEAPPENSKGRQSSYLGYLITFLRWGLKTWPKQSSRKTTELPLLNTSEGDILPTHRRQSSSPRQTVEISTTEKPLFEFGRRNHRQSNSSDSVDIHGVNDKDIRDVNVYIFPSETRDAIYS